MFVFIDESGSFVAALERNLWNVITAYLMPEVDEERTRQALTDLHKDIGVRRNQEIKLRDIDEQAYFRFLARLAKCHGIVLSVATDSGLSTIADLERSREEQASKILANQDKMKYAAGKQALQNISDKVRRLSPQLYVQLRCQVILMDAVVRHGSLYFVQRLPSELGRFAWRIDQKNRNRTEYEKAFRILTPIWLQSMSLRDPIVALAEADYTAFKRFDYPKGQVPTYLRDEYGYNVSDGARATNLGRLIHEDFQFVDSATNFGIQIADLVASGLRRCLRRSFEDNQAAAYLLGRLMLRVKVDQPPIALLGFSKVEPVVPHDVASLVGIMASAACPVLDGAPARR